MTDNSRIKLEKLLSYSLRKEEAERAARAISEKCVSLTDVSTYDVRALKSMFGLSERAAILILLAAEATARRVCDGFSFGEVHSEEEIIEYFKHLLVGVSQERIYIMCLDERRRAICCELVSSGSVSSSSFSVRRLVEIVLERGARSVYIAHNHPRGYAKASRDDVSATEAILAALETVRVKLLAHFVVSGMSYDRVNAVGAIDTSVPYFNHKVASEAEIKN